MSLWTSQKSAYLTRISLNTYFTSSDHHPDTYFVIVSGIWFGNIYGVLSDILFWHFWHSFLAFYLVYLRRFFVVVRRGTLWSGACKYCKLELTTLTWQVGKHISFPYIGCLRGIPLMDLWSSPLFSSIILIILIMIIPSNIIHIYIYYIYTGD